jgi:hypothetical protein
MRILYLFLLQFIFWDSFSQFINPVGNWYPIINSNAVTEAGLNYGSNYAIESASNQTNLSLSLGGGVINVWFNNWRVDIRKEDINWNPSLQLQVRRTTNGAGTIFSSISGGANYQNIQNNSQSFFQGVGAFNNINIQYRLSGFSVLIPVDTYSTNIIYTLIDI